MRNLKRPARLLALAAVAGLGCFCAIGVSPSGPAAASGPVPGIGIYSLGGHLAEVADPSVYSKVIGDAADADTLAGMPGRSLATSRVPT